MHMGLALGEREIVLSELSVGSVCVSASGLQSSRCTGRHI